MPARARSESFHNRRFPRVASQIGHCCSRLDKRETHRLRATTHGARPAPDRPARHRRPSAGIHHTRTLPSTNRYIGWYSAAYGYDGFLRWAYDAWPADPVRDARHALWPAGDEFLVYPGASSSVRFEKLREGIVDYERIRILRALASQSTNGTIRRQLRELDNHLATFVGDRDYSKRNYDQARITEAVHKGMRMLEALSDRLAR